MWYSGENERWGSLFPVRSNISTFLCSMCLLENASTSPQCWTWTRFGQLNVREVEWVERCRGCKSLCVACHVFLLSVVTKFQGEMAPSPWVLETIKQGVESGLTSRGYWHERSIYCYKLIRFICCLLLQGRITYSDGYRPGAKAFTNWRGMQ